MIYDILYPTKQTKEEWFPSKMSSELNFCDFLVNVLPNLELGNNERWSLLDRFGNRKWSSQIQEGLAKGYGGWGGTAYSQQSSGGWEGGSYFMNTSRVKVVLLWVLCFDALSFSLSWPMVTGRCPASFIIYIYINIHSLCVYTHTCTVYITLEQNGKGGLTLKLYADFGLGGGSVPLTPALLKGQLYIYIFFSFSLWFVTPLFHISFPSLESLTRSLFFFYLSISCILIILWLCFRDDTLVSLLSLKTFTH